MTTKTIKCYRWVKDNMTSQNGKVSWEFGKWNKVEGDLELCENGLHAYTDVFESMNDVYGNRWFVAEARGKILKDQNSKKICASEMRLVKEIPDTIWKRFSLFCAKDCLKNYSKEYPNDSRVSDCIKAVEDFLEGKITKEELIKAQSAARSAESAARSAASAAESAERSAESAASAAESAERSAESAERSAESAARSAASAAWSAARSAASAAWSAAWSAAESAESAAWSAARSAERKRQKKYLLKLIKEYLK